MIIIMLGAPGSGKGSVAEVLSDECKIPKVSSGDIFREHIKNATELGNKANEYISQGQLVPDNITINMIIDRLKEEDAKNGAILDGFPRTVAQAEAFDKYLEEINQKIDIVIELESTKEEILQRVVNRRICSNVKCRAIYNLVFSPSKVEGVCDKCGSALYQREDDTIETTEQRLEVYDLETAPLIDYYENKGVIYKTDLSHSINRMKKEVAKDVIEKLS